MDQLLHSPRNFALMSSTGTGATPSTWQTIADDVNKIFGYVSPLIAVAGLAFPGAGTAFSIVDQIVQGYSVLEPTAAALVNQIKSGEPVTAAQLAQYVSDRQAAYLQAKNDIAAALAALPPTGA